MSIIEFILLIVILALSEFGVIKYFRSKRQPKAFSYYTRSFYGDSVVALEKDMYNWILEKNSSPDFFIESVQCYASLNSNSNAYSEVQHFAIIIYKLNN